MKRPYRCLDCKSRIGTAEARKGSCPNCGGFDLDLANNATRELNFDNQEDGILSGVGATVNGDTR